LVDFLGAKTKKNRQQSEEMKMKARERRNRGPTLMLYEREYSTKIELYTLLISIVIYRVPSCIRCIHVYMCVHTMDQRIIFYFLCEF
jgi:hypothetical protein